jgi:hypothetical membrane protein
VQVTDLLLIVGLITAVVFLVVLFIEGALRPDYNPTYHTGSELTLGERGWVQIANFIQMGIGMFAFALGVNRALDDAIGAILLAVFALGLIVAGIFRPDPLRNYPPHAAAEVTWHGQLHNASGPLMFLALAAACLVLAGSLDGPWRIYTVISAVIGVVLTTWTAVSFQRDAANTGLVQRTLILVYWVWVILTGIHLTTSPPPS